MLAELFLEGQPLFELSQLLAYRRGQYDPSHTLEKVLFLRSFSIFEYVVLNNSCIIIIIILFIFFSVVSWSGYACNSLKLYTPFLLPHDCLHAISDGAINSFCSMYK